MTDDPNPNDTNDEPAWSSMKEHPGRSWRLPFEEPMNQPIHRSTDQPINPFYCCTTTRYFDAAQNFDASAIVRLPRKEFLSRASTFASSRLWRDTIR